MFDLNDFDETCRGPFEWDLKRLAASLVVGGRAAGKKDSACGTAVREMVQAYRQCLDHFSAMPVLELTPPLIDEPPQAGTREPLPPHGLRHRHAAGDEIARSVEQDRRGRRTAQPFALATGPLDARLGPLDEAGALLLRHPAEDGDEERSHGESVADGSTRPFLTE